MRLSIVMLLESRKIHTLQETSRSDNVYFQYVRTCKPINKQKIPIVPERIRAAGFTELQRTMSRDHNVMI